MKNAGLLLTFFAVLLFSCQSAPDRADDRPGRTQVHVTQERYDNTMAELRSLIGNLNAIMRARNFNAWIGHLAESYYAELSSRSFLEARTEELFRRDQMIAVGRGIDPNRVKRRELSTVRDYFEHVVVPSRSNDRLDEIVFTTNNRVVAYTIDPRGMRLILYELVLVDGAWKIIK